MPKNKRKNKKIVVDLAEHPSPISDQVSGAGDGSQIPAGPPADSPPSLTAPSETVALEVSEEVEKIPQAEASSEDASAAVAVEDTSEEFSELKPVVETSGSNGTTAATSVAPMEVVEVSEPLGLVPTEAEVEPIGVPNDATDPVSVEEKRSAVDGTPMPDTDDERSQEQQDTVKEQTTDSTTVLDDTQADDKNATSSESNDNTSTTATEATIAEVVEKLQKEAATPEMITAVLEQALEKTDDLAESSTMPDTGKNDTVEGEDPADKPGIVEIDTDSGVVEPGSSESQAEILQDPPASQPSANPTVEAADIDETAENAEQSTSDKPATAQVNAEPMVAENLIASDVAEEEGSKRQEETKSDKAGTPAVVLVDNEAAVETADAPAAEVVAESELEETIDNVPDIKSEGQSPTTVEELLISDALSGIDEGTAETQPVMGNEIVTETAAPNANAAQTTSVEDTAIKESNTDTTTPVEEVLEVPDEEETDPKVHVLPLDEATDNGATEPMSAEADLLAKEEQTTPDQISSEAVSAEEHGVVEEAAITTADNLEEDEAADATLKVVAQHQASKNSTTAEAIESAAAGEDAAEEVTAIETPSTPDDTTVAPAAAAAAAAAGSIEIKIRKSDEKERRERRHHKHSPESDSKRLAWERERQMSIMNGHNTRLVRDKKEAGFFANTFARAIDKAKSEHTDRHETPEYQEKQRRRRERREAEEAAERTERKMEREKRDAQETAERQERRKQREQEREARKKAEEAALRAEEARRKERKKKEPVEAADTPKASPESVKIEQPRRRHRRPSHGESDSGGSMGASLRPNILRAMTAGESECGGLLLKINVSKAGGVVQKSESLRRERSYEQSSAPTSPELKEREKHRSHRHHHDRATGSQPGGESGADSDRRQHHRHHHRHHTSESHSRHGERPSSSRHGSSRTERHHDDVPPSPTPIGKVLKHIFATG